MTRKLLISNVAVVLTLLVCAAYISVHFGRFNPIQAPITVEVDLERAGGLYTASEVTFLGSRVGKVTDIRPRAGGVRITASIDADAEIPRDTVAVVSGLSPVGEQYLDFRPRSGGAPYLEDGDEIAQADTGLPVEFSQMLRNVALLADQVDIRPIRTVVDELSVSFGDAHTDLRRLLVDSDEVLSALEEAQPATLDLLEDGGVVLSTANDLRDELAEFSRSARDLTSDIRAGEPVWREVVAQVPPSLRTVLAVIEENSVDLGRFMDNASAFMDVLAIRGPAVRELLAATPRAANVFLQTIQNGEIRVLTYLATDPDLCAYGPTEVQPPWIARRPPVRHDRHCRDYGPELQQRGAYYAPRPTGSRTARTLTFAEPTPDPAATTGLSERRAPGPASGLRLGRFDWLDLYHLPIAVSEEPR